MYRFNNGSLYKFSEKRKAFIHVTVVPSHITNESKAIEWYEHTLRSRRDEEFLTIRNPDHFPLTRVSVDEEI